MNGQGPPFCGKYRGIVTDNRDPIQMGRIRARVPDVLGDQDSGWALPCVPYAGDSVGLFLLPPTGANVWIEFEHGDPDYPIWSGGFWALGQTPTTPATPEKKVLKTDTATITIDDTPGTGGITIEAVAGMKIVITTSGIEINDGQADQEAAIDAAQNPGAANPFVTRVELPLGLTVNQKDALDRTNQPGAANPVANVAHLGRAGVVTRTVAAGTVDLSILHSPPSNGLGGLEVVDILPERGIATLHFEGYQLARKGNYLIKTLPIRADAKIASIPPLDPLGFRQFIVVQLVEFKEQGFELQMIQPLHQVSGAPALGPCMIEVSEILTEMPPVRAENAHSLETCSELAHSGA